eukprot:TRINITY_DN10451_c0_g1_i1.p1 TRINITY_DN10451_c0_g1~~TRINITY_DN10451_c0_g1_i1.p1  ORF type:complete len:819 (-),score=185.27 TRINITY_DN10451_c0_g1_i1:3564-6020(-)
MDDQQDYSADKAVVKVVLRLRPLPDGKPADELFKFVPDQPTLIIIRDAQAAEREYKFDTVFNVNTTQEELFESVAKPMCDHVLNGFNACCFAYGQTGSGKTYSMVGEGDTTRGIIPRSMEYLFDMIERRAYKKVELSVSFLEIYLDNIRDLGDAYLEQRGFVTKKARPVSRGGRSTASLGSQPSSANEYTSLQIRERPTGAVYVEDLSQIPITRIEEVYAVIAAGFSKRQTYETLMNPVSSRSHTIFTLTVTQTDKRDQTEVISGRLNLVDLAGSERLARSHSEGERAKEAALINKSLSALGNVVMALDGGEQRHIPYRDSKLTRILTDSLGGNSYTSLLATLNPSPDNYEECVATLQFAHRCRNVTNMPVVNYMDERSATSERRLKKLQMEIADLRAELRKTHEAYQQQLEGLKRNAGIAPGMEKTAGQKLLETTKAVDTARRETQSLMDKMARYKQDFKGVKDRVRADAQAHLEEKRALKETVNELLKKLEVQGQEHINALNEVKRAHEDEVNRLIAERQQALDDHNDFLANMPDVLNARATQQKQTDAIRTLLTEQYESALVQLRLSTDKQRETQFNELKRYYEAQLDAKQQQIDMLRAEAEQQALNFSDAQTELKQEVQYMYEYSQRLSMIIENMEAGHYNVWERSGIKGFVIPQAHKPAPVNFDICKTVAKLIGQADSFISRQQVRALAGTASGPATARSTTARSVTLQRTQSAPAESDQDLYTMSADALRREVARLRAEVTEQRSGEHRSGLKEQVENDLASHPTISYMRKLEDERERYKQLHQAEQRRVKQLQVALDAKERLFLRTNSSAR